ncbi:MAG: hypothetical protein ACK5JO_16520 [Halodesulfovibrio sp.]
MSDNDSRETGKERFAGFSFSEEYEPQNEGHGPRHDDTRLAGGAQPAGNAQLADDAPLANDVASMTDESLVADSRMNGAGREPQSALSGSSFADDRLSVRSLAVSIWSVLFRQQNIFGHPFEGRWDRRALAFTMIVTALIPLLQQAMLYLLLPVLNVVLPDSVPLIAVAEFLPQRLTLMELVRDAGIIPLLIPVPLAIYAAILHGLLRLAQSGERGYAVTFQTVCYTQACWLLSILPGSSGYVAIVWWLGVLAAGLRLGHRSRWHRVLPVMALHASAAAWLVALANGWVLSPF